MAKSLAIKYRPKTFSEISEQESIRTILQQQLATNEWKHAYLFCGPAGCGKTTAARIFANELNNGEGNPIELDAASNNGVDDVREIIKQAKTKSLDSSYKVFIIDECVTGDTEILTKDGWKRIDSITKKDEIAQYTKDGNIEFVKRWEYVKKEYEGPMYNVHFRNGKRSVLMSPHHVQPTRKATSGKLTEEYIQDAKFGQKRQLIVAGNGVGNNEILTSLDRLYIACQADGYCNKNKKKTFWELHLSIPKKVNRALDLLDDCGIEYVVYGSGSKKSIRFYYDFPKTKKLKDYFSLDMGKERAEDFIQEILLWDGSTKSGYPGYYSCTDKDNVDFVSCVLALCGCSATVNVARYDNPNHKDVWSVNWYYQDYRTGQAVSKEVVEDWKGNIYCVKVPSKMIVLRAEGFTFISGNCHSISNAGWQAFLKIIEEPPATSIFLFCTTDPQKIPKTILSRVQRYNFNKISTEGIVGRLHTILDIEGFNDMDKVVSMESLSYIAKLAEGGMRDAITMLDKCIAYSSDLSIQNVVAALGTVDYDMMFDFTDDLIDKNTHNAITSLDILHLNGKDLKQFVKSYIQFLVDVNKYLLGCDWKYINLPELEEYKKRINGISDKADDIIDILDDFVKLDSKIKYSAVPKYDIEAMILLR